jgi:hypothetical protein
MNLDSLPNELLRDIIQNLRPYNKHEPITGLNAAWKPLSAFRQSLKTKPSPNNRNNIDGEEGQKQTLNQLDEEDAASPYATIIALRSYVLISLWTKSQN